MPIATSPVGQGVPAAAASLDLTPAKRLALAVRHFRQARELMQPLLDDESGMVQSRVTLCRGAPCHNPLSAFGLLPRAARRSVTRLPGELNHAMKVAIWKSK
jgi:hypothetical protein